MSFLPKWRTNISRSVGIGRYVGPHQQASSHLWQGNLYSPFSKSPATSRKPHVLAYHVLVMLFSETKKKGARWTALESAATATTRHCCFLPNPSLPRSPTWSTGKKDRVKDERTVNKLGYAGGLWHWPSSHCSFKAALLWDSGAPAIFFYVVLFMFSSSDPYCWRISVQHWQYKDKVEGLVLVSPELAFLLHPIRIFPQEKVQHPNSEFPTIYNLKRSPPEWNRGKQHIGLVPKPH